MSVRPLSGVRVLDFSTLLPGPLFTLLLAEAGAEVIKIERPGRGDEMRSYEPRFGNDSVNFALLNRGKRSITLDLKSRAGIEKAQNLAGEADILVEQFRPGVMQRLGIGYEAVSALNPRLVYCSITGYGQAGPMADVAAHDLNYQAESGMLGLCAGSDGAPVIPPTLTADIAGGAYPAVMNILLALRARDSGGRGCHLDISMADNLFTFMYWGLGNAWSSGAWPEPGGELVTGGTPRYQIYRTADDRFLAAAPLEEKFWEKFLDVLGAPGLLDDSADPAGTRSAVATIIASRTADEWKQRFAGVDACTCIVSSLREAMANPHFAARGLFRASLSDGADNLIPALPVPIASEFRSSFDTEAAPVLGEGNSEFVP
ncbi:MAG: CaiB/BaiF CoA-transferase family protein [Pseudomonadota bacterium]|jgi:crotonobetainyl-CoA:carnitine CoA-transferase CaiB-like acyl-CoA transferase|nr:CaiB/BaiF CoA-transferase family protein [Pseudomonadota bacterium]